ncbi:acyl-CoA thioesterase [Gordonia terrae NBRC 100016]|nr:acyl-CoA thioesterase [Gordonia terrae NBRC 100016]
MTTYGTVGASGTDHREDLPPRRSRDLRGDVDGVLAALDVVERGPDTFVAESVSLGLPRLFGGQILAQAFVAASRTVPASARMHSLHAYFLRSGDPRAVVELEVARLRDGRTQFARSVTGFQNGRPLVTVMMSFARGADGIDHQVDMPAVPHPAGLPCFADWRREVGATDGSWGTTEAIDVRVVPAGTDSTDSFVWQRAVSPIPDDPTLQQAMLIFMSDITTLAGGLVPHGVQIGHEAVGLPRRSGVSLDHAIWFHRPVRADNWLLFAQSSPASAAGKGLIRSDVFSEDGRLVLSLAQQGMYLSE